MFFVKRVWSNGSVDERQRCQLSNQDRLAGRWPKVRGLRPYGEEMGMPLMQVMNSHPLVSGSVSLTELLFCFVTWEGLPFRLQDRTWASLLHPVPLKSQSSSLICVSSKHLLMKQISRPQKLSNNLIKTRFTMCSVEIILEDLLMLPGPNFYFLDVWCYLCFPKPLM